MIDIISYTLIDIIIIHKYCIRDKIWMMQTCNPTKQLVVDHAEQPRSHQMAAHLHVP